VSGEWSIVNEEHTTGCSVPFSPYRLKMFLNENDAPVKDASFVFLCMVFSVVTVLGVQQMSVTFSVVTCRLHNDNNFFASSVKMLLILVRLGKLKQAVGNCG